MSTRIATAAGAGADTRFFVPFSKVEEKADGSVYFESIATAEVLDLHGEIVSHEASVAAFKEWTEWADKATGGESIGNLREMHGPNAAGKAVKWTVDDANKSNSIGGIVVDTEAAKKTKSRVYTGVSIGGDEVKREMREIDGKKVPVITSYRLTEVSVVDKPACPVATFTMVKRFEEKTMKTPTLADGEAILSTKGEAIPPPEIKDDKIPDPLPELDDEKPGDDANEPATEPEAVPPADGEGAIENAVKAAVAPILHELAEIRKAFPKQTTAPEALVKADLAKVATSADVAKLGERLAAIESLIQSLPAPPPGRAVHKTLGGGSGNGAPDVGALVTLAEAALAKAGAAGASAKDLELMRMAFAAEATKAL